ncbi:MAG: hypothetical protein CFE21_02715 [Bacteroidetes bacterium B1(2017)]|nr:MAG: hypothetical protein CFE21_02715 [Bacteroidetes bacterium B1(2017)]
MAVRAKLLFLFVFIGLQSLIRAQNPPFEHLNEQNGLSQLSISALYQGPKGFIWVGTDNGLFRYDGNYFETVYDADERNEMNGMVLSINGNQKWMAVLTQANILIIDPYNLTLKFQKIPPSVIKPKKILMLREELLISSESGLWSLKIETGVFSKLPISEPITDFQIVKSGKVIISSIERFYTYYPFIKKVIPIEYYPNSNIKNILVQNQSTISWIESDNYFHEGNLIGNALSPEKSYLLPQTNGSCQLIYYNNKYLLGTQNGLLWFSPNGPDLLQTMKEDEPRSLSQNNVTSLLKDRTGNLWVGTKIGGLNLHQPYRYKFNLVSPLISSKFSKCKEILSFSEAFNKQIIFQNALGEIGLFDPKANQLTKTITTKISGNCLFPIDSTKKKFFIGGWDGLYEIDIDKETQKFISTKCDVKNFESDVKIILPEGNNQFWMGGEDGLFLFDLNQKKTIAYYGIGNSNIGSENIRYLTRKSSEELYVCTMAGLYLFNTTSQNFKLVQITKNKKQPLIASVGIDKNNSLWVATGGEGIYCIKPTGETINYTKNNGLSNNMIYSLQMNTSKNECWVSSNNGLSCIHVETNQISNYDLHDGIQGSEFIENSSLLSSSGDLYFGGVNGFNYFEPANIPNDTNDCKVVIKSLSLFDKKEPFSSYYRIPIEKNYLVFEFSALDYYLKGNHTYYYKLEGLQEDWTEIGERRFAGFAQLGEGDYVFRVKVKSPDGRMSKQEAKVYFSIVPPFYKLAWIKFLGILFFAGIVSLLIYLRIKNALKEEQEKGRQIKMIAELELKALRAQMNPHFIFNSLNSIQDFVLNNEGQLAAKYLSKFAKLIRMILDISEQTFVSIHSKIDFLKLYIELEALRLNNSFTFNFDIDPEIDLESLIPTLLIQPHVENAIWHGLQYKKGQRELLIRMRKADNNLLEVIVEDNGIGRSAAMEIKKNKLKIHNSFGAKITEDRINTLNKLFGSKPKIEIVDLFDKNNLACGTKVIMQIPITHG